MFAHRQGHHLSTKHEKPSIQGQHFPPEYKNENEERGFSYRKQQAHDAQAEQIRANLSCSAIVDLIIMSIRLEQQTGRADRKYLFSIMQSAQ